MHCETVNRVWAGWPSVVKALKNLSEVYTVQAKFSCLISCFLYGMITAKRFWLHCESMCWY